MANDGGRSGKAASRRKVPGTTGRVTPKGTPPRGTAPKVRPADHRLPPQSGRYTPPVLPEQRVSARWVPLLMFALLAIGVLVIIVNYLGILPGGSDNRWLLLGLAAITGGFITATQYR
jgi:hypothetical protein